MLLGDIIKKYRDEHFLSLQGFADLINSSKSYVQMLERNFNPSTGKPISPSIDTLKSIAEAMGLSLDEILRMLDENQRIILNSKENTPTIKIPILGYIRAGIPIKSIEEILGYEEIPADLARTGDFFCLKAKGDSMFPYIIENDIIVFKKQSTCESGEICVVLVNGDESTIKSVKKSNEGITLIPYNRMFAPIFYSNDEIINKPVTIIGVFKELRRKNINI